MSALTASKKTYDFILLEMPHPTADTAKHLSVESFEAVKARLGEGGAVAITVRNHAL